MTPAQRFDASFFGDPARAEMRPQRTSSLTRTTTSAFSSLDYGGHNQTVRYEGVTAGFSVEAAFAHTLNQITETPSVTEWFVTNRW